MSKFAALRTIISADAGNVAARHEVRMQAVTHYYDVALRGNKTQLIDGLAFANSIKGNVAKAYVAGFQAAGMPEKYPYQGKLSAAVADEIAAKADELAALFSKAFAAIVPIEEAAEKTAEEKAKAKAEKEEKAEKAHKEWAEKNGYIAPENAFLSYADMTASNVIEAFQDNIAKFSASDLSALIARATAQLAIVQTNDVIDAIDAKAEAGKRKAAKAKADKAAKANGNVPATIEESAIIAA